MHLRLKSYHRWRLHLKCLSAESAIQLGMAPYGSGFAYFRVGSYLRINYVHILLALYATYGSAFHPHHPS